MSKNLKIVDEDGVWVTNSGAFRLPHPLREGVFLEPGTPTQIKLDGWILGQSAVTVEEADRGQYTKGAGAVKAEPKDPDPKDLAPDPKPAVKR